MVLKSFLGNLKNTFNNPRPDLSTPIKALGDIRLWIGTPTCHVFFQRQICMYCTKDLVLRQLTTSQIFRRNWTCQTLDRNQVEFLRELNKAAVPVRYLLESYVASNIIHVTTRTLTTRSVQRSFTLVTSKSFTLSAKRKVFN